MARSVILGSDGKPLKKNRRKEAATPEASTGIQMDPVVAWLKDEIDTHERTFDKFLRRGRKILKKYRDVRSPREDAITRYNILWANVQTRLPALYARNPKPVVERRFKDRDPVGRTSAEVLERSIDFTLEQVNDLFYTMRLAVQDYELPGLAAVWIRYEPHFHKPELPAAVEDGAPEGKQNEETETEGSSVTSDEEDEVRELKIKYEETIIDYLSWEDIGWSWARIWSECRLVWKRVYMDRDELRERFGDTLSEGQILAIPLDWSPKNLTDTQIRITRKKAIVYEIHDKLKRKRYWLVKNFPTLLDERADELGLSRFFPLPRPMMANALSDELLPTPNYTFYQDQANEIDELSTRIVQITKALKVAGVRDASAEGLDRLLSEGVENQLVPVSGWAAAKDRGGLAGSFELLPMKEIAETLQYLRDQRQQLIEDVYQLTGISDIVRGFSDPNETATAQQMKGDFSLLRIEDAQTEVQRFVRDIIRIVGEIVAQYDIETIKQISGVKLLTNAEKQQLQLLIAQQAAAQAQAPVSPTGGPPHEANGAGTGMAPGATQSPSGAGNPQAPGGMGALGAPPGQGPGPAIRPVPQAQGVTPSPGPGQAPVAPEKLRLLELPSWEDVAALLENPCHREFRLDIETDSTVRMNDDAEKESRIQLLDAVGQFLDKAVNAGAAAPEIVPMLGELMMFGVRAFKSSRSIEQTLEDAMVALQKSAQQPKPNPEAQKAQLEAQTKITVAHMQAQFDTQKAQAEQAAQAQQNQLEQQLESARAQHDAQLQAQLEQHKAHLQAATQQQIEEMKGHFEAQKVQFEAHAKMQIAMLESNTRLEEKRMELEHESKEGEKQREHERSMPKEKPNGSTHTSK